MTTDATTAALLERVRRALDFDEARFVGGLVTTGSGVLQGLRARWQHATHVDGRVMERVESRLPFTWVYDGDRGWTRDPSGHVGPLDLTDLEFFRISAAVLTGRWLCADGRVEVGPARAVGERYIVPLRCPGGDGRYLLTVDARSHRPVELTATSGAPGQARYERFELRAWCRMPRSLTFEAGHLRDTLTVDTVTLCDDIDATAPGDTSADEFDASIHGALRVGRTPRGRLPLVYPHIDGREVGAFLFDTGASSMAIDAALADRLSLPSLGRTWVSTSDGGTGACFRRALSFALGPLNLRAPILLELDLAAMREVFGVRLAGIVGYDVFARCVVDLRGDGSAITLRAPGSVGAHDLRWAPLRFEDRCPLVRCASAGGDGLFALDSGSASAVTCYAAAAHAWGLPTSGRASTRLNGASGSRPVATRTLPHFSITDTRFASVRAVLLTSREGLGGAHGRYGTVGWPLLRRLDATLDYPGARLGLPPPPP